MSVCVCVCVSVCVFFIKGLFRFQAYCEPVNTPDVNRQGSLLCVLSVVVLLSGGLGQGVAGAVADPREGLLAGQGSHAVHPVTHCPHRGHL